MHHRHMKSTLSPLTIHISHTHPHPITPDTPTHLYFHKVHWLHKTWFSREDAGIEAPPCGWNDLSTTTVDGVCVQSDIMNVEPDGSCILLTKCTL